MSAPARKRAVRLCLLAAGLYTGTCLALAWNTVRPKRHRLAATPADRGLSYERVSFTSADGTRLSGWLVPAKGRAKGVIILCHGVDSSRLAMLSQAELLHRHGFATLLFDFRARGESEGERCTLGYREVDDLLAAIRFAQGRRPDTRALPLGVLGESLGGAVAILGAARSPAVRAVVAESPFARLDHAVANHFRFLMGPTAPVLGAPVRWIGEKLIGCNCARVAPIDELARIAPRPLLLIEDADDRLCPPEETRALLAAAGEPKALWTVPGAGHVGALHVAPEEYERRVVALFEKGLGE